MAITAITDVFNPQILSEAVQGVFNQKTAFMGSALVANGAVIVNNSMPMGGQNAVGQTITVPYFGTIGSFVNNPDGSAITPNKIQQTSENGTITRDSLGFEVSRWAQGNALINPLVGDPYQEAARQILVAAIRAMDARIITAASASGVYQNNVYSSSVPRTLDWDLLVDSKVNGWGDEQDSLAGMVVHSQTHKDLMKLKDTTGRPLLLQTESEGSIVERFCGLPVVISDRVPLTGSTMGAVTATGTTPPTVTLSGTPLGAYKLQIDIVVGGTLGTATFRFSTDGGNTWSATMNTAASVVLTDTAIDSTVGQNGATGITATFNSGTYNADNLYTSTAALQVTSLLVKKNALAFWYSSGQMGLETFKNIFAHTDQAAMHLYAVAYRYRRIPGGTKPGVVQIVHNVSGY